MRLAVTARLGARLRQRARELGDKAALRWAGDHTGEPLGRLPATSMLPSVIPGGYRVAGVQGPDTGTGNIDEN